MTRLSSVSINKRAMKQYLKIDTRTALVGSIRPSGGNGSLITVEIDDKALNIAACMAIAHTDELRKLLGKLAVIEAQQSRMFFKKRLGKVKYKIIATG